MSNESDSKRGIKKTTTMTIEVSAELNTRWSFEYGQRLGLAADVYIGVSKMALPKPFFRIVRQGQMFGLHFKLQGTPLECFPSVSMAREAGQKLLQHMGEGDSYVYLDPFDTRCRKTLQRLRAWSIPEASVVIPTAETLN